MLLDTVTVCTKWFADVLEKAGHKVHLEPIADWNAVELIVHGEQVFDCDIRDLDFGNKQTVFQFITSVNEVV